DEGDLPDLIVVREDREPRLVARIVRDGPVPVPLVAAVTMPHRQDHIEGRGRVDVEEERIAGDLSEGEGRDAVERVTGLRQADVREGDVDDEIPLRPVEAPGLGVLSGILDDLAVLRCRRHAAVAWDPFRTRGRPGPREERRIAARDGASSRVED